MGISKLIKIRSLVGNLLLKPDFFFLPRYLNVLNDPETNHRTSLIRILELSYLKKNKGKIRMLNEVCYASKSLN